jgi:serine/threonine protein kinase
MISQLPLNALMLSPKKVNKTIKEEINEADILKCLDHENVVKLYDLKEENDKLYMFMVKEF